MSMPIVDHQCPMHRGCQHHPVGDDEEEEAEESRESFEPIAISHHHECAKGQAITSRSKMERGISRATENEFLVTQARCRVEQDFFSNLPPGGTPHQHGIHQSLSCGGSSAGSSPDSPDSVSANMVGCIETPVCTFQLPDLTSYSEEYQGFLHKDLIELSSLNSLEQSGRLNWWAKTGTCQRVWPLATTGDGNCLLHAASLAMWGFHDRLLTLRKALHTFLTKGDYCQSIYRRWRWQSHLYNTQFGLTLSEAEWQEEWRSVLKLASTEPRHASGGSSSSAMPSQASTRRRSRLSVVALPPMTTKELLDSQGESSSSSSSSTSSTSSASMNSSTAAMMYESLEEVHVLALAHILRRPIIVVADTVLRDMNGEALAPIPFGGIYLPLEILDSTDCHKSPLLLTYNAGHFSALVTMQSNANKDPYGRQQNMFINPLPAVIPVTDADHCLLPVQFSVDPGPHFQWNSDEYDAGLVATLTQLGEPAEHLGLLNLYLELVRVALPDWLIDLPPSAVDQVDHHHSQGKTWKTGRQIQNVAKQFGSIGKKLKKNFVKISRSGSGRSSTGPPTKEGSSDCVDQALKIVSGSQSFILGAVIHTNQSQLPYQSEMIDNYLMEAKQRFESDQELKAKRKQEQIELNEKLQREIYLNGGFVDCVQPGCQGQGTSETSYLCKPCFSEQTSAKKQIVSGTGSKSTTGNQSRSTFYGPAFADHPPYSHLDKYEICQPVVPVDEPPSLTNSRKPIDHHTGSTAADHTMRVKLPQGSEASARPCRNTSCDFYGTPELDYFCSKCHASKAR